MEARFPYLPIHPILYYPTIGPANPTPSEKTLGRFPYLPIRPILYTPIVGGAHPTPILSPMTYGGQALGV
jgi:hypothetical protein